MKKTIATIAMMVSANAATAMPMPRGPNDPGPRTICLETGYVEKDGSINMGTCDMTDRNTLAKAKLNENGCADNQVAMTTFNKIATYSCMPAGAAQL